MIEDSEMVMSGGAREQLQRGNELLRCFRQGALLEECPAKGVGDECGQLRFLAFHGLLCFPGPFDGAGEVFLLIQQQLVKKVVKIILKTLQNF